MFPKNRNYSHTSAINISKRKQTSLEDVELEESPSAFQSRGMMSMDDRFSSMFPMLFHIMYHTATTSMLELDLRELYKIG